MGNFVKRKNFNTLFIMDITSWLSLVIAILAFTTPAQSSEPRVVCYYTNWSVYRPGTARFNPQNINPYLCTHLIYAFGGFTKDNTLKPFDKYQDIEKGGYAKFTGLKTYNKNLKTMLAIGGWNEGSTRFSPMVAARDRRKEFVRNAIKFLRQNRFDGLDLDWEYPAFRDGGKPKDRENYSKLVRELREEFEREAEKTGKPRLLLTMAVPAGIEYIQKGFDVKTLNQYLDWMNLLTYDYHSAFEPAVNHHAPLFPLEEPNEYSVDNELNIDYTIKFYLENGADRDKLVLGIPTYGRSYTLFNPDAVEIGSPADGPGEQGDATREKGYLAYYEICEALKPSNKKRSVSSDEDSEEDSEEVEDEPWTIMHPNPNAMGPVAFKGNQWVGYDDVDIVRKKAEYVAENGLGGIMFWSIDNDDFRGNCHGKPYPLIEAAKEVYITKLGSTDNTIVRDKPKPVSSSSSRRRKNRPRTSSTTTTTTTTTTTPKPTTAAKSNKRKSSAFTSTTPAWNIITPEPPTTPDPGSDFKCTDEGFFQHPRDCKKYFWCLDSGPSNLGIVAHQFTCPSGLFFNKAADSCDFARNVLCKTPSATTKAPTTKAPKITTTTTTTTTTRKPIKLSTKSSIYFRTSTTTTTTPEPEPEESEEEYEDEVEDSSDIDAEDPKVIKELIDLIKKVGGVEQLEKHLRLGETPASTGGTVTTTQSSFNKKLYQKVLERTRGNKLSGNSLLEGTAQNSRRRPQNAGLEPTADKDKLLRKDRPQYVTINRARSSTTTTTEAALDSEEIEYEPEVAAQPLLRARAVEPEIKVATTAKPLQYVNIRRARPTLTTSDTADDTASRNALFERSEPLITVSEAPSSLDITNAKRENIPEYVTIRRRRPNIEETTTVQYHNNVQEVESQETVFEKEISSPSSQPQYTSILRTRSTTTAPLVEPNSPEPTTVLAVQISSLLNSPSSTEPESEAPEPETTLFQTTEITEPSTTTTTSTTTSTTTTSTAAPSSLPPRRTILRRRGSTTTTTSTPGPSSSTQVSSRNYTFVRRRRPLSSPNDISLDSDETSELSRKIRSTTPDSREVDGIDKSNGEIGRFHKYKNRFQSPQSNDDSVASAALLIQRGRFRPQFNRDELLSLTPIDNDTPQEVQKPSFIPRTERRFRSKTSTTTADVIEDSEVSAATVEIRRPNILPRNRGRFTPSPTTKATEQSPSYNSSTTHRRPTFTRFTPRPFTRSTISITTEENLEEEVKIAVTTQRLSPRLPFGRARPSLPSTSALQARKLPFPSPQLTTQQTLITEHDNDESDNKNDDISLSESAIEEKEHEDEVEEPPKRRIIVKKLRAPGGPTIENTISTEIIPTDDSGKRKFRVIRRRPTSTTTTTEAFVISSEAPTLVTHKIRKIIRKKLKPAEDVQESEIIAKSVGSLSSDPKETSTETVFNYGEKTKPSIIVSSSATPTTAALEHETEPATEIITELTKIKINTGSRDEIKVETTTKDQPEEIKTSEKHNEDAEKVEPEVHETEEIKPIEESSVSLKPDEIDVKPDVLVESEEKSVDLPETKESAPAEPSVTEAEESQPDTTTTSTTRLTSPSTRTRLPYRPPKRLFTSTTESSISSSSRTFSRKYNPGAYTSPATIEKSLQSFRPTGTRKTLFSSKTFTRRPFTTPKTTQKLEDDEEVYSDEEILEEEPEHKLVILPPNQLFTRPKSEPVNEDEEENYEDSEETSDEEEETPEEETSKNRFTSTSRKPIFKPRVINSNTFRTSTSTTELPRRQFGTTQNRTAVYNRFGSNKPSSDIQKRVQNVPVGYNTPVGVLKPKIKIKQTITEKGTEEYITTTNAPTDEKEATTISDDDDFLLMNEATSTTVTESTNTSESTSTNNVEIETATIEMEIDNSTDDYLEFTEETTNYPSTQESKNTQTESGYQTSSVELTTTVSNSPTYTEVTTEQSPETTTNVPQVSPIIKTQYNKLFSVSRVVEISSKLDKHRLNKNNETTLIEEGKIMIEKKPVVDKIGEVSRFSLIKIFEDEIPIYLTKLGHVYPVENPPYNPIRIDEARNARALAKHDIPKENLIASESMNEAYRHVNEVFNQSNDNNNSQVMHVPNDDFLSYINDDKKSDKSEEDLSYPQWQFIPAAYENEKNRQNKAAKSFDIVTPRNMLTDPSTLPLEALFKTENPIMANKVNSDNNNHPFVVYSAPLPTQKEGNLVKLAFIKPELGRSIITFAKGQEFNRGSAIEETTVQYPINISVLPKSAEATSTTSVATPAIVENVNTSPIIELLTTTPSTTMTTILSTEAQTTHIATTEALSTTETTPDETTTLKMSPLDVKRLKLSLPRKSILKASNITRTYTAPRLAKKINATVISNLSVKPNKTSGFNPSKSRFSAIRTQNVPVDVRKKTSTPKTFTTEAPKATTERKLYFKPIRPNLRPAFVPRKNTTPPPTVSEDT